MFISTGYFYKLIATKMFLKISLHCRLENDYILPFLTNQYTGCKNFSDVNLPAYY